MLVKDFITRETPVLKNFDSGEYALSMMDDYKLRHLPLLKDNIYQCLVSEKDLLGLADLSLPLGEPLLVSPAVRPADFIFEAMSLTTRYGLSLLPVVSEEGEYQGAVLPERLLAEVSKWCAADGGGSVIVLEIWPQDYALSEIARLVESNNAHLLSLLSYHDITTGRTRIVLKIDLEDASPVIRSFERFDYTVVYHFMRSGVIDNELRQRMDELLFYMNM